jgi:hypothetical protein
MSINTIVHRNYANIDHMIGEAVDLLLAVQLELEQQGEAGGHQLRVQEDEKWTPQHTGGTNI